jgi:hypothetical protein
MRTRVSAARALPFDASNRGLYGRRCLRCRWLLSDDKVALRLVPDRVPVFVDLGREVAPFALAGVDQPVCLGSSGLRRGEMKNSSVAQPARIKELV